MTDRFEMPFREAPDLEAACAHIAAVDPDFAPPPPRPLYDQLLKGEFSKAPFTLVVNQHTGDLYLLPEGKGIYKVSIGHLVHNWLHAVYGDEVSACPHIDEGGRLVEEEHVHE